MPKELPARPNLEHLRTQAKALLAKIHKGDQQAARTFIKYLPAAAALKPAEIRDRGFRLADAQAVIARKTGFGAWPSLARHVERLRGMEGTWAFRTLEVDGQAVPANMLGSSRLLIDGDRFRMESPEANYEGIFTIDVEHSPHRIDIDFVEGPEAGNRCEGLFELHQDCLRICLGLAGSSRPEKFETAAGSGHALEDLVRVEHARPPAVDGSAAPAPAQHAERAPGPNRRPTSTASTVRSRQHSINCRANGSRWNWSRPASRCRILISHLDSALTRAGKRKSYSEARRCFTPE